MKTAAVLAACALLGVARAASADVQIVPSPRGVIGAWMVMGPSGRPKLVTAGGPGQDPGSDGSRTIDLKTSLDGASGRDIVAFASGRLHVESAGRYFLLLGVDDGVTVSIDGKVVLARDEGRPLRDDDDVIALDLTAGDHEVLLRLHQRDGAWAFRARFVDASFAAPAGAYLSLVTSEDATAVASRMSWLVVDRAFDSRANVYRPVLTVRYPEGAPRGVPIAVHTKIDGQFDMNVGGFAGPADLVVALPPLAPWQGTLTLESIVAGRVVRSTLVARPASEQALAHLDHALAHVHGREPWLVSGSLDSARHLGKRLARFLARGDADAEAQADEAKEVERVAAALEKGIDPYAGQTGMMRRALVTPFDAAPTEYGLYVPPSFGGTSPPATTSGKKYPLIIGLHGMNSAPLSMMRALFGQDEEKKDPWWKDRHAVPLPPVEAFVITPYAHGNTMYRDLGEDDVLYLMEWAKRTFPIDESRITITGPSMGGIGAAAVPLHYPGVFAAAEPLCGYHSYLIRAELNARPKRLWERFLLEERSNVLWAENGEHLPLYIVHGQRDLPEANSGVLIERYEKLKYSVKHEHPDLGHNVWGVTYGDLKGIKWLLEHRLEPSPSHVRFRTMRTRYAQSSWVTVDGLTSEAGWADIDARQSAGKVTMTTSGASELTLGLPAPLSVTVDGTALSFADGEAVTMHRDGAWTKGPATHAGLWKHGHIAGPIRDVFHEPITFVYADGDESRANLEVARSFADRPGIPASYPVMSDTEFLARRLPLANERSLFLVGRDNKVLKALSLTAPFPVQVDAGSVSIAGQTIKGREVGAAFIYPNPTRPDRYVVVVAGADAAGTMRAMSLPDLLPDFVVWDADVASARGQVLLGAASLRAGGFFKNDWSLPAVIADPLGRKHD